MRKGLFTVGALDNLDYNPPSTTAQGSFHGTAISVFQFPTHNNSGISEEPVVINPLLTGKFSLPDIYTNVPAVACNVNAVTIPECRNSINKTQGNFEEARTKQMEWINHAIQLVNKEQIVNDCISWSAYYAALQNDITDSSANISLLPLFYVL